MIRFLADASLHDAIATGCLRREPTIDFLSATEARLEGVPDPEAMPRHFGNFLEAHGMK